MDIQRLFRILLCVCVQLGLIREMKHISVSFFEVNDGLQNLAIVLNNAGTQGGIETVKLIDSVL